MLIQTIYHDYLYHSKDLQLSLFLFSYQNHHHFICFTLLMHFIKNFVYYYHFGMKSLIYIWILSDYLQNYSDSHLISQDSELLFQFSFEVIEHLFAFLFEWSQFWIIWIAGLFIYFFLIFKPFFVDEIFSILIHDSWIILPFINAFIFAI